MKELTQEEILNMTLDDAWNIAQEYAEFTIEEGSKKEKITPCQFEDVLPYPKSDILFALLKVLTEQKREYYDDSQYEVFKESISSLIIMLEDFIPNEEKYKHMLEGKKLIEKLTIEKFTSKKKITKKKTTKKKTTKKNELDKYKEAIKSLKQAIRINPDDADAQNNLGYAYGISGKYKKAIEPFKQAIEIDPDLVEAHYLLGLAYRESGKYKEAIKSLKQALRIEPDDADAHFNLGRAYLNAKKYEKAILSFKQAIRIDPDYPWAHYNLACSYSLLGDVNKALKFLGKAIDSGFNDIKYMDKDSDLNGLRDEAGYKKLINKLKR